MSSPNRFGSKRIKSALVYTGNDTDGGILIQDTAVHAGNFNSILCLAAAVAALTNQQGAPGISGDLSAVPIPAGTIIRGNFASITLASGKVIAYF